MRGPPAWTWSGPTTPLSGKPCDEPVLCRPPGEIRGGADPAHPLSPGAAGLSRYAPGETTNWCSPFPGKPVVHRPGGAAPGGRPTSASAGWLPPNFRRRTQWYPPGSPAGPSSGPFTWPRWTAWGQSPLGDALRGPPGEAPPTRAMEAGASPRQAEAMLRDRYRVSPCAGSWPWTAPRPAWR